MYFEGRELKEYAEPVSATELREGDVYFALNYVDCDLLVPVVETVVFIGRDLEPDDVGQVYIQDVESYREEFVTVGITMARLRSSKLGQKRKWVIFFSSKKR